MKHVVISVIAVLLLLPVRSAAQSPTAELYPILFVHGLCSSAETWTTMTAALSAVSPSRYGTVVTPLSAGRVFPAQDPFRRMFAINFRGLSGSFDSRDVAQVPIGERRRRESRLQRAGGGESMMRRPSNGQSEVCASSLRHT